MGLRLVREAVVIGFEVVVGGKGERAEETAVYCRYARKQCCDVFYGGNERVGCGLHEVILRILLDSVVCG